ncbi:MarR family winged helix-turn-helix transcriptional regulator [Yinghuangia seranimata]|uniref:MarR family winged helix-turn-helix transcriptional regulator n=1 Tax=Yinghuangia seranimata TaxID=408067 RepID=UPI00248BF3A9|nr:MarR family transcriptional regulator [Yinghuangia seranimata]MDI2128828.1 MarR family transcriptional regulator [Yinghuangia seranimata]
MTPDEAHDEAPDTVLYDRLQHEVALFARRAEQTRLGAAGELRYTMDRAAYLLLGRLEAEGPMGVKALAQAMSIDSSTVTRQVTPLVDQGYVDRVPNPDDGRAVLLRLSEIGLDRLHQVRRARIQLMAEMCAEWSAEDRERFTELLTRFNQEMVRRQAARQFAAPKDESKDEPEDGGTAGDRLGA